MPNGSARPSLPSPAERPHVRVQASAVDADEQRWVARVRTRGGVGEDNGTSRGGSVRRAGGHPSPCARGSSGDRGQRPRSPSRATPSGVGRCRRTARAVGGRALTCRRAVASTRPPCSAPSGRRESSARSSTSGSASRFLGVRSTWAGSRSK